MIPFILPTFSHLYHDHLNVKCHLQKLLFTHTVVGKKSDVVSREGTISVFDNLHSFNCLVLKKYVICLINQKYYMLFVFMLYKK